MEVMLTITDVLSAYVGAKFWINAKMVVKRHGKWTTTICVFLFIMYLSLSYHSWNTAQGYLSPNPESSKTFAWNELFCENPTNTIFSEGNNWENSIFQLKQFI